MSHAPMATWASFVTDYLALACGVVATWWLVGVLAMLGGLAVAIWRDGA